jgi:hypothetical protein
MATIACAQTAGFGDSIGKIAPGVAADLVRLRHKRIMSLRGYVPHSSVGVALRVQDVFHVFIKAFVTECLTSNCYACRIATSANKAALGFLQGTMRLIAQVLRLPLSKKQASSSIFAALEQKCARHVQRANFVAS